VIRQHVIVSVLCVLAACGAALGAAVRTPKILAEGQVDTTSVETMIRDIIKPGMTQRQKAEAVYEFMRAHVYHAPAPREGPKASDFAYGVVYDPVKLINVYGYTYCFGNRSALEALWQAAGLEARSAGIGGHSIAEVFYDGQYHFYDADQQGYCLLADGKTVASIAQIERDPIGLIVEQKHPSRPFFPATKHPKVPYESKVICASYFASRSGGNNTNYYQHDKTVCRHRMGITLVPGMRYVRGFLPEGKYAYRPSSVTFESKVGYFDPAFGPTCYVSGRRYGNGRLLWQPDLRKSTGEYAAGVWEEANIAQDEKGLMPAKVGAPAHAVFRVKLPYVVVGQPTSWTSPPKPVGAAVVAATFYRNGAGDKQAISVSSDRGRTWTTVWTNEKTGRTRAIVDLSEHVVHRYEYMVRFEMTEQAVAGKRRPTRLSELTISTYFQLAPTSLPALKSGANKMTFRLGDQTEAETTTLDLSGKEGFLRDVHSYKGIWFRKGQIRGRYGKVGEIVCELMPPKPGAVAHVAAGAGLRRQPWSFHHKDDVKIYVAEGEPKNWTLVYDDDVPTYMRHWSYHGSGGADCSPGTRKAYVKFAIRTESSVMIQRLWTRLHWRPEGKPGLPERGVKVAHTWLEKGEEKRFEMVVSKAPTTYTLTAGSDVTNRSVVIEPVRDPRCAWREGEAVVTAPKVDPPELLDAKLRDEWRTVLRKIDEDPKKWLSVAAKSKQGWLAGGAKQALAMYRMRFPIRPKPPAPLPQVDAATAKALADEVASMPAPMVLDKIVTLLVTGHPAGRDAAKQVMTGPDTYRKLAFLGKVGRYAMKAVPDELLAGLRDESRWVRLAVLEMIRRAPSKAARTAVEQMAKDDPLVWLRAEAKSVLGGAK
jgi:hypothetical protein